MRGGLLGELLGWQGTACCRRAGEVAAGVPCPELGVKGDGLGAATGLLAGGVCTPLASSSSASSACVATVARLPASWGAPWGVRAPVMGLSPRSRPVSCAVTGRHRLSCSADAAGTLREVGGCSKAADSACGDSGLAYILGAALGLPLPGPAGNSSAGTGCWSP